MRIPEPKPWWFPTALAAALLILFIGLFVQFIVLTLAHGDQISPRGLRDSAVIIACVGGIVFPIGLCAVLVWSGHFLEHHGHVALFVGADWIAYLAVVIAGIVKPSKILFLTLLIMLILNIGGCWFRIPRSPSRCGRETDCRTSAWSATPVPLCSTGEAQAGRSVKHHGRR